MSRFIDSHVHSDISHDGVSPMIEHMNEAHKQRLREITFTEHFDDYTGIDTDIKELDVSYYRKKYLDNKNDNIVKTNFGIEIGLRPESEKKIKKLVKENDFDFIIGSSHITCGKDMAYDKSFFEGLEPNQAILNYLSEVIQNIIIYKDDFDVYGHLDYVIRYVNRYYQMNMDKIDYDDFNNILNHILLKLIRYNKGLEINTSGLRYGLKYPHPNIDILKKYKQYGGKIITLGSDAHKACDLAYGFDEALDILEEVGFNEIAVYHNREPEFVKIKSMR